MTADIFALLYRLPFVFSQFSHLPEQSISAVGEFGGADGSQMNRIIDSVFVGTIVFIRGNVVGFFALGRKESRNENVFSEVHYNALVKERFDLRFEIFKSGFLRETVFLHQLLHFRQSVDAFFFDGCIMHVFASFLGNSVYPGNCFFDGRAPFGEFSVKVRCFFCFTVVSVVRKAVRLGAPLFGFGSPFLDETVFVVLDPVDGICVQLDVRARSVVGFEADDGIRHSVLHVEHAFVHAVKIGDFIVDVDVYVRSFRPTEVVSGSFQHSIVDGMMSDNCDFLVDHDLSPFFYATKITRASCFA